MPQSPNIDAAIRGLNDWLRREQLSGRTAAWLPDETLQCLRQLPEQLARPAPVLAATAPRPVAEPSIEAPPRPAPQPANSPPASSDEPARRAQLNALALRAKRDPDCLGLGSLRDTMVFASGNPSARLMFVGEAPGYDEEQAKKPFVGPAGQLLTKIIEAMGLQRDQVYISNIVKFRPMIDDGSRQGRSNRKPTIEEMAASVKYIRAEIDIVRPEVIVALGGTAASGLLGVEGSVGKLRNQFHDLHGTPVMVTYHPSYLLYREKDGAEALKAEKRKVWEDMRLVLEKMGQPLPG